MLTDENTRNVHVQFIRLRMSWNNAHNLKIYRIHVYEFLGNCGVKASIKMTRRI